MDNSPKNAGVQKSCQGWGRDDGLHSTKCVVVALVMRVRYVSKCCRPAFPVCINSAGLPIDRKARCLAHGYHQKSPGTLRTESLSSLLHGKMEELRMNSLESRIAILVKTRLGLSALHALYAKFPELTAPSPGSQLRCKLHPLCCLLREDLLHRALLH